MKSFDFDNWSFKKYRGVTLLISFVGAFILYGNTLGHNYALDDAIVITKNEFTKQGVRGIADIFSYDSFTGFFGKQKKLVEGGRYRPLSLAVFAIEYEMFGENPWVGHLFNILTYALLVWLVFLLAFKLFDRSFSQKQLVLAALVSGIYFLIHPIHTEAVANIKGRDELLSLGFSLLSLYFAFKYYNNKNIVQLSLAGLALFLGCLAKENAITFVLIIPILLWFYKAENKKRLFALFISLLIPALIFIGIRNAVLGSFSFGEVSELMNNPFSGATSAERFGTVLFTWLVYLKLLIFPHPLTFDYYPYHIQLIDISHWSVWLSLVLLAMLALFLYKNIIKRTMIAPLIIGFILSFSVVSNVFFPVGVFMNERFVFMPSFFFSLLIAYVLAKSFYDKNNIKRYGVILIALFFIGFYPAKTIARNKVWKDDLTLFLADVKTSQNSAKSNCSAGGKLWEKSKTISNEQEKDELMTQSEIYLRKSLSIYPQYSDAWLLLGNVLFDHKNNIKEAFDCYLQVLSRQNQNENAWKNVDIILQNEKDYNLQLSYYLKLNSISGNRYLINYRLGVLYGRYMGDLKKGIEYFEKAVSIDPTHIGAIKDLGTAYGMTGQSELAYKYFKKGVGMDPSDKQLLINLSVACRQLNKIEEAEQYEKKIEALNK